MQQIAVRAVQLDGIEAEPHGPLRGLAEGGGDAREALGVERLGRRPLGSEGNGRGRDGRPSVLAGSERLAALPRPLAGRLAPGVPDLDGKARAGRRDAPRRVEHARERRLVGIRVEAEAAVRDAPRTLHRRWPRPPPCRRARWPVASGAADANPWRCRLAPNTGTSARRRCGWGARWGQAKGARRGGTRQTFGCECEAQREERVVIPGLVPGIQPSAIAGASSTMDPGEPGCAQAPG